MTLRWTPVVVAVVVLSFGTPGLAAAHGTDGPAAAADKAIKKGALPRPQGRIVGSVWNSTDQGVDGAMVRLRNITTGTIDGTVRADGAGQFVFDAVNPGNYIIEVVNANGSITALGSSFGVAAGETIATFVRLGPKLPMLASLFGNVAASTVSSAASIGLTAITPEGQNISPDK